MFKPVLLCIVMLFCLGDTLNAQTLSKEFEINKFNLPIEKSLIQNREEAKGKLLSSEWKLISIEYRHENKKVRDEKIILDSINDILEFNKDGTCHRRKFKDNSSIHSIKQNTGTWEFKLLGTHENGVKIFTSSKITGELITTLSLASVDDYLILISTRNGTKTIYKYKPN